MPIKKSTPNASHEITHSVRINDIKRVLLERFSQLLVSHIELKEKR